LFRQNLSSLQEEEAVFSPLSLGKAFRMDFTCLFLPRNGQPARSPGNAFFSPRRKCRVFPLSRPFLFTSSPPLLKRRVTDITPFFNLSDETNCLSPPLQISILFHASRRPLGTSSFFLWFLKGLAPPGKGSGNFFHQIFFFFFATMDPVHLSLHRNEKTDFSPSFSKHPVQEVVLLLSRQEGSRSIRTFVKEPTSRSPFSM